MGKRAAWVMAVYTMAGTAVHLRAAGPGTSGTSPLTEPLATAVMLLGWFGDDVPQIEVVGQRPSDARPTAEAWVRYDEHGRPIPIIFVLSTTAVYREAAGMDYQALVRLAGVLAHERWHLRHGPDEKEAYTVQLSTMEYLHASRMNLAVVRRALAFVSKAKKKTSQKEGQRFVSQRDSPPRDPEAKIGRDQR